MNRPLTALALALAAALAAVVGACGDNLTHPTGPTPYESDAVTPLSCVPNLDGEIDADELLPATGIPVSYLVSAAGTTRAVDLTGAVDAGGKRVWDFTQPDTDPVATITARAARAQWYGDRFPSDAVAVPLDAAGRIDGVYRHDADLGTFSILGIASRDEAPPEGQTLWTYDAPVVLYRFPLGDGDAWTSVGEVRDGVVQGLPYAGRDTYQIEVSGAGELVLPDVTFTQVLRVRTHLTAQPAVGASRSQWQVSFLFECFGEVARATSRDGETAADFTTAAEVRRFGL
ncbi:MAG: hypothetical protein KC635_13620 [Myxococcales bacterium]|nr:hypothetical protein [Myxococcales bacterium]